MGHQHLKRLQRTRRWKQVFELLELGNAPLDLAAETAIAAERDLLAAIGDPALTHAFWLLTQLPLVARADNYSTELHGLGFDVEARASLFSLTARFTESVDDTVRGRRNRTDLGEMATLAAVETLSQVVGRELPSLFDTDATDLRNALAKFATPDRFAELSRDFYTRLTFKTLDYYVSRELAQFVGPDNTISSAAEATAFRDALNLHCREASLIVEEFSKHWFSKTNYEGGITPTLAGGFVAVALQKLRDELKARRSSQ